MKHAKTAISHEAPKTGFAIRKVVTEMVGITIGQEGKSPGQLLDETLANSAHEGDEIQMVEFFVAPSDWEKMRRQYVD